MVNDVEKLIAHVLFVKKSIMLHSYCISCVILILKPGITRSFLKNCLYNLNTKIQHYVFMP